jgi:hypothetical protein
MRPIFVRTTLAILAALAAAGSAAAQEASPGLRIHILPSIGRVGGQTVGAVDSPDGRAEVRHGSTTTLGLAVEATTPIRWLDVRLGGSYTKPQASLGQGNVYRTSVKSLTLDAVVRGPRILEARPYALVGAGLVHYDFKQSYYDDSNNLPVGDDVVPAFHLGAGLSWSVGRYDLFAEGGGLFARPFDQDPDTRFTREPLTGGYFSVGARIPIN